MLTFSHGCLWDVDTNSRIGIRVHGPNYMNELLGVHMAVALRKACMFDGDCTLYYSREDGILIYYQGYRYHSSALARLCRDGSNGLGTGISPQELPDDAKAGTTSRSRLLVARRRHLL